MWSHFLFWYNLSMKLKLCLINIRFYAVVVQSCLALSHGRQHARLPCPSLSPRLCSNSYPLHQWYHPTISSSCCPLHLLPSIFPIIRIFSSELGLCIRWPKYWSFSFSISPSSEYSGLISFKIDWFDLLVQGTLKSLLTKKNVQHILNGDSRII